MSVAAPGHLYTQLAEAAARKGSARSLHGLQSTLSRRGLLHRADRRAKELSAAGVARGQLVALPLGNGAPLVVTLLACSKLGAVPIPLDPVGGERLLRRTATQLPLRAVVRRPRGQESITPDYGRGYRFVSRRRLPASLLMVDVLDPPAARVESWSPPAGAELVVAAPGIDGTHRHLVRTAEQLAAIGHAAALALDLREEVRLVCAQPVVVPRFFDPVVLAWLASDAQLVLAEGAVIDAVHPLTPRAHDVVVVDSARELLALARALGPRGARSDLRPVVIEPRVPDQTATVFAPALPRPAQQLLVLEELGVVAHRSLQPGARWQPTGGVQLRRGAAMQVGGHEVLVQTPQAAVGRPPVPPTEPGSMADAPFRHSGYAGRFTGDGDIEAVLGRDDGLVYLEDRRASLDHIEDVLLTHPRLTWVHALDHTDTDGETWLRVEYRADGPVDDLHEFAIGHLPPFMVPRRFERQPPP